ncbi:MAG: DUF2975 domain-containing protein [Burkholderiales bacterium]|nr:DUF2975 domain-containing protein [Burkholderiales bacterium]
MHTILNQKLITTSKIIHVMLQILLMSLIFMIIIPWVFPTSELGKFLLSIQGFYLAIESAHKNINEFMASITLTSRFFGVLGSFIALLPLLLGTLIMLKLSANYIKGNVFNLNNAKLYQKLGIIYLISAIFLQPIYQMLFCICVTINNPVGKRFIAFSIDVSNLNAIFFALVLIIIGQVMKLGHKISQEQELTV